MEMLRKLTIKAAGGWTTAKIKEQIESAKLENGQSIGIIKVVGKTTGAKTGQTDKGTYVKLTGEFFATDLTTGEAFSSASCILPNFVSESIAAALAQSPSVEFALEIGVKRNDTSVTGYEFTVRPLIEAKPSDTMMALLNAAGIDPAAKALPAPAADKPAKAGKGK